jgi:anti-sigma factor RsiW
MSVSEADLDLLDSYLDDELTFADADELRERLASEAELGEALEQLRRQRELRATLWRSMEPDQKTAQQFSWRVRGLMRRDARWGRWMHSTRVAGATAACLLIGIFVGRAGNDTALPMYDDAPTPQVVWNSSPIVNSPQQPAQRPYRVSLTDSAGRVIAVQHFSTLTEAREFAHDVGQWQAKHRQVRSGNVRLTADEF